MKRLISVLLLFTLCVVTTGSFADPPNQTNPVIPYGLAQSGIDDIDVKTVQVETIQLDSDKVLSGAGYITIDHKAAQVQVYGDVLVVDLVSTLEGDAYAKVKGYAIKPTYPIPFMSPEYKPGYLSFLCNDLELWGDWKVNVFVCKVNAIKFSNSLVKPSFDIKQDNNRK